MVDDPEPLINTLARLTNSDIAMMSIQAKPETTIFVENVAVNYGSILLRNGDAVNAAVMEVRGENVLNGPDEPAPSVTLILTPELFEGLVGYLVDTYREIREMGHFPPPDCDRG
jgi:hypothetical protein